MEPSFGPDADGDVYVYQEFTERGSSVHFGWMPPQAVGAGVGAVQDRVARTRKGRAEARRRLLANMLMVANAKSE